MLSKVVNQSAVLTSYHAYVTSTLRYGIIFWGNCTERETIFKAQKKCLRSVCHLQQTDTCKPHFKRLKILPYPCLYISEIALFIKRNLCLFDVIKSKRIKYKICMPPHRTALYDKSIFGMGPRIYNKLPKEILETGNIDIFKSKLFKFLIDKVYYSVNEYLYDK